MKIEKENKLVNIGAPPENRASGETGVRAIKKSKRVINAARYIVHFYFNIPI